MQKLSIVSVIGLAIILLSGFESSGCSPQQRAQSEAEERAADRPTYIPKNAMEWKNYDRRQRIADDPTTIMWCTSAFPIPNSPLFTVPIVGKTTSGGKRPFAEDPGADGMYGPSNPYDYGFTPVTTLSEWRNMPQYCTNEPLVWQRQATVITMATDTKLMAAQVAARTALAVGMQRDKEGAIVGDVPLTNQRAAMKIIQDALDNK